MSDVLWPILFTLFVWWFSTGVILYLDGLPSRTFKWTLMGASLTLLLALAGLAQTRHDTSVFGAYAAFSCAVLVWAWQEVAFLLGFVTGPRRTPCPAGLAGWQRARHALQTVLHHEIALVVLAVLVVATTWDGSNATGLWTFMILWVMRQSAKLNIFLGVRNLNEGFLPTHLAYLHSYFRCQPMNALFPASVLLSTIGACLLWQAALAPGASAFHLVSFSLCASMLTLAVVEHWFMVLPLPSQALWNWGLRSRA